MMKFVLIAFISSIGICADINELAGRLPGDASCYFMLNTSKQMQSEINKVVEKSVGIKDVIPTMLKKLSEVEEMKELFQAFDEAKVKPEEVLTGKTYVAIKVAKWQKPDNYGRTGTILVAGVFQISDSAGVKKILEKFQKEAADIEGTAVICFDSGLFAAVLDDAVVFAGSDVGEVSTTALKNIVSKTGTSTFKSKAAYKELVGAADSCLAAYRVPDGVVQALMPSNYYSMSDFEQFMQIDAVFGIHAIKGAGGAIELKGGNISSAHEIGYEDCLLKEHITVLGGVKEFECAGYVPESCTGAIGLRTKGGANVFDAVDGMMKNFRDHEARDWKEADEEFKSRTGFGLKDACALIQDELVAFAMIGEWEKFERKGKGFGIVGKVSAGKELSDLVSKLADWIQQENGITWALEEYKGKQITYSEGKDLELAYVVLDNCLAVGFGKEVVKAIIDTQGKSFVRAKAGNCTAFVYENTHSLAGLLADNAPADFPKIDKNEIKKDAYGITRISFEQNCLKMASEGPSVFNLAIPGMVAGMITEFGHSYGRYEPVVENEKVVPPDDVKLPDGKDERAKLFAELVQKLGSDDPDERESSMQKLLAFGEAGVEYLVPAYEKASDAEIRSRIVAILKTLKKYSAIPALADSVVSSTVAAMKTALKDGYPMWNITEDYSYYATPSYIIDEIQYYVPQENKDAFADPEIVAKLVKALSDKDIPKVAKGAICLFTAQCDTTKAEKIIFDLIATTDDEYTKGHLYTMLGKCNTPDAEKKVAAGLKSDSIAVRRACFYAAGRCKSREVAHELLALCESGGVNETRLLASWTLLEISGGGITVNPFLNDNERKSQIYSARLKLDAPK